MAETGDATPFLPDSTSLAALRDAAAGCRGCHLYGPATQTVFGEGPRRARVMMVGEMPGDREDREGHPFVGPAGRELDEALADTGIDRDDVYVTNVVKHFKFEERGKRRIHQTPRRWEVQACMPWLRAELTAVRPNVLVLLGATAGKALLGTGFKLTDARGATVESTRRRSCGCATTRRGSPPVRRCAATSRSWPKRFARALDTHVAWGPWTTGSSSLRSR
jgi:uracil-DNA glycosylase family protein